MSSASFSLVNVWLANPIKIRREETRVGSGVNTGYVSHDQMVSNVINGANRSFWSSVYIWFYIWFSVTASVRLIFLKNTVFRKRRKMQFLDVGLSRKALITWNLVEQLIYFMKYFSWVFRLILAKFLWRYQLNFKKIMKIDTKFLFW